MSDDEYILRGRNAQTGEPEQFPISAEQAERLMLSASGLDLGSFIESDDAVDEDHPDDE